MANTIEHFVAPFDENTLNIPVDQINLDAKSKGFWGEAWSRLSRNPIFYITTFVLLLLISMVLFPGLWTPINPRDCQILDSTLPPGTDGHILGTTEQGCDVFSRLVYGARTSLEIGILVTLAGTAIGMVIGTIAGYFGGIFDAILTRVIEIFQSVPSMLAFVVILQMMKEVEGVTKLIIVFTMFGWMQVARLTRANVMSVKNQEFVNSAKALGVSNMGRMFSHVLPNSIAPVIATAMMSVGAWIITEASISFLGVGLSGSTPSWGIDISNAVGLLLTYPQMLFFPCLILVITSLTFILLGDAVQDAIDPKARM